MTAREPLYEEGCLLAYVHRGESYVGVLVKSQRRAAVIRHRGRDLTVPWTAVRGSADRKGPAHTGG